MDETVESEPGETVGERLRAAREAQKITLEAVAAQTRIPVRHLASLEASEWDSLPAPAYCVGFAKNFAAVVGLDRSEIAEDLRAEMGGTRQAYIPAEVFQPADPKRAMPRWLIIVALVGVMALLAALYWWRERDLTPVEAPPVVATGAPVGPTTAPTPTPTSAPVPVASGPVTITANQDAWIKVRERGGKTLKETILSQGATFDVPATATAPLLDTGRPEALRITVGGKDVPAIGTPGHSVSSVSLLAADLARGPAIAAAAPANGAPAAANGITTTQ